MPFSNMQLLWGPGLACAIGLVLAVLGRWQRRWARSGGVAGVAICAAMAAACPAIFPSHWRNPQLDPAPWLFYLSLLLLVLGIIACWRSVPGWIGGAVCLFLGMTLTWQIARPLAPSSVTTVQAVGWAIGLGAIALGDFVALESLARKTHLAPAVGVIVIWALAAAIVLADGSALGYALAAGTLVAASVGMAIASLGWRGSRLAGGGVAAPILLLLAMLVIGFFYDKVPARNLLIITLAPITLLAGDLPGVRRWPVGWRWVVRLGLLLGVLAIAVAPAVRSLHQEMQQESGDED